MKAQNEGNIVSVLLHDYYHRSIFHHVIDTKHWNRLESRLEKNVDEVCALFDRYKIKATFFALGWLGEKKPELVKRIAQQGHEIANAGYYTRSVREMTPVEFKKDLFQAKRALEQAGSNKIIGYRCAHRWFSKRDEWALNVLSREGYRYDASIRPPFWTLNDPTSRCFHQHCYSYGTLLEFPVSTARLLGINVPISGGTYLRQLPEQFTHEAFRKWQCQANQPFVLYFHPWELDKDQPRINQVGFLDRVRQYRNLGKMSAILPRYFEEAKFQSIAQFLDIPLEFPGVVKTKSEKIHVIKISQKNGGHQDVTIVIPCYNEVLSLPYLANTLAELQQAAEGHFRLKFIFIDDCSTDNTYQELQFYFGNGGHNQIIRQKKNGGVAAAIQRGIQAADTDVVCSIDADCTYDPLILLDMIPRLNGADMVVASPYHEEGNVLNVPKWRLFLSKHLAKIYHVFLNNKIATYTSCFRVYRRLAVCNFDLENGNFIGVVELLARLDLQGGKIVEYPTTLHSRLLGYSKMKVLRTICGHLKFIRHIIALRKIKRKTGDVKWQMGDVNREWQNKTLVNSEKGMVNSGTFSR